MQHQPVGCVLYWRRQAGFAQRFAKWPVIDMDADGLRSLGVDAD
jgi:hypothetical protein